MVLKFLNKDYHFKQISDPIISNGVYVSDAIDETGIEYTINWDIKDTDWEYPVSIVVR